MSHEKNTEREWWYRPESEKAKVCDKCAPICRGQFKKVVEFTDSGLSLYAHSRKTETKSGNTSNRSFVLCNSSGRSINNSEIPLKEMRKYNTPCSTCSDILDETHKLLTDIKTIGKNEVLGICEHCHLKGLPTQCEKCIYITNKFLQKRVKHIEYRHDQLKKWFDEIKEMLLAMIQQEVRSTYHEEASKYELKRLLRELQKPRTDHELNIRTFPESEIEDAEAAEAVEREKKMLNKVIAILESEKFSMKGNLEKALGPEFIRNMPNKILGNLGSLTKTKLDNLLGSILTDKIIEKILHNFGRPSKEVMDQVLGTDLTRQIIDKMLDNVGTFTTEKAENMFGVQTSNRLIDSILNKFNSSPTKDNFEKIFGKYVLKENVSEIFADNFKEQLSRKQLEKKFGPDEAKTMINEALNNFGRLKLEKLEKIAPGDVTKDIFNKLLFDIDKLIEKKLINLFDPVIAKKTINTILNNFGDSLSSKRIEEQLGSSLAKEVMKKLLDILRQEKLTRAKLENSLGFGFTKEVLDKILANIAGESSTKEKLEKLLGHEAPAMLMHQIAPVFEGVNFTVEMLEKILGSEVANKLIDNMLANLSGEAVPKTEGALKGTKQSSATYCICADVIEKRTSQTSFIPEKSPQTLLAQEKKIVTDDKKQDLDQESLKKKATKKISDGRKTSKIKLVDYKKVESQVSIQPKEGLNEKGGGRVPRELKWDPVGKKEGGPKETEAGLDKKEKQLTLKKRNEKLPIESEAKLAKKKTKEDVKGTKTLQVIEEKQESETELSKLLKKKQLLKEKQQKKQERTKQRLKNITSKLSHPEMSDLEGLLNNIIGPDEKENEEDTEEKLLLSNKIIQERKPFQRKVKKTGLEADELEGILNEIKMKSASKGVDLTLEEKPKEKIEYKHERIERKDSKLIDLKDMMDNILALKAAKYKKKVVKYPIFQAVVRGTNAVGTLAVDTALSLDDDEELREELLNQLELFEAQEKHKLGKGKGRSESRVFSKSVSDTAIGKEEKYTEKGLKTSRSMSSLLRFLKAQDKDEGLTRKLEKKLERDLLKHTRQAGKKLQTNLPLLQQLKKIYATEIKADVIEYAGAPEETKEMIKGTSVVSHRLLLPQTDREHTYIHKVMPVFHGGPTPQNSTEDRENPLLFKTKLTCPSIGSSSLTLHELKEETSVLEERERKGVLRYQLSNPEFIRRGWTKLPTLRTVRQMNIYKMYPANPAYDWFNRHKNDGILFYETGEKLAEIDEDGHGRWYYRNGVLALDFYKAEEKNIDSRYVVYSSGERDENGNLRAITVLASFDLLGNGIVYDHTGHERLKYNQSEGILLDEKIGPLSKWKWHHLNDFSPISCILVENRANNKNYDEQIENACFKETMLNNTSTPTIEKETSSKLMLAIERENYLKKKRKMKAFKKFQIKPKNFKINDYFSVRIIDQGNISLMFRDGQAVLKQNLGLILKDEEIIDKKTMHVGEVLTPFDRPKSTSVENLISIVKTTRAKTQAKKWLPEKCKKYYKLEKPLCHENIR